MDTGYMIAILLACGCGIVLFIVGKSKTQVTHGMKKSKATRSKKELKAEAAKRAAEAAKRAAEEERLRLYEALPHRFGMRNNNMTYSYCTLEPDILRIGGTLGTTRTYRISDITGISREQKAHEHTLSPKYGSRKYTAIYTYIHIYAYMPTVQTRPVFIFIIILMGSL